jgi:hypothetical protein
VKPRCSSTGLTGGTPELRETYSHDRNTIEIFNDVLMTGPETLDKPQVVRPDRRIFK